MPVNPSATTTIVDDAGGFSGNTGYCVVLGCVATNADNTPRVFTSGKALTGQHGYSQAASYVAMHIEETGLPVVFVGMPIATAGALGSHDDSAVTGTSVITVAASSGGILDEVDATLTVTTGGTIGTNGIVFNLSLDGGVTVRTVRLGTATSYVIPYVGITISFAAGTLVAGDVYLFRSTAPKWDSTGLAAARTALAAQTKLSRTWMVIGEVTPTEAGHVVTQVNAYETAHDRFTLARAAVTDRLPLARAAKVQANGNYVFAEVGATGDTITRTAGSWIADGFAVGDNITITGSANNNITTTAGIAAISATVITLGTDDLVAETIAQDSVTIVQALPIASWVSATDAAYNAVVGAEKRVDLSLGRRRKLCPITGWQFRRPVAWAASIREYQHDLHIATWRKSDGPLSGWSGLNSAGNLVEYDETIDGGGLAGRFTCARSWSNGPNGTFVAMSLTRADENSILSRTHNMHVANLACTIVQSATENSIGESLILNANGTATEESLGIIEMRVNSALQRGLLANGPEGPRASSAVWTASRSDVLNVVSPALTGVLVLNLRGSLESITTTVRIPTNGQ